MKTLDINISLPFKGRRNYVQSADIFDACAPRISNFLNPGDDISLSATFIFRSFINTGMRLIMSSSVGEKLNVNGVDVFGNIIVEDHTGKYFGQMVRNNENVDDYKPDFESDLLSNLSIVANTITLAKKNKNLSPTETSIALTKILHLDQVSDKYKWIATRLELPLSFSNQDFREMSVEIIKNAGNRTTQSLITCDGIRIGKVMFSAMHPEGQ